MVNASQIRERLADWIDGRISLSEFEGWFVPETWNIHKANDAEAESLVDEIELRLSEYSGGHMVAKQLRKELKELAKYSKEQSENPIVWRPESPKPFSLAPSVKYQSDVLTQVL